MRGPIETAHLMVVSNCVVLMTHLCCLDGASSIADYSKFIADFILKVGTQKNKQIIIFLFLESF